MLYGEGIYLTKKALQNYSDFVFGEDFNLPVIHTYFNIPVLTGPTMLTSLNVVSA